MQNFLCLLTALTMTALLFACEQPGPAERAGRSIDRAAERVRDTVDPPQGPAERAGRAIDRTVN